jgi:hypothetical protein
MAVDVLIKADIGYEYSQQILAWTKQHCKSYITNSGFKKHDQWCYAFHFNSAADATLFRLKFSEDLIYD